MASTQRLLARSLPALAMIGLVLASAGLDRAAAQGWGWWPSSPPQQRPPVPSQPVYPDRPPVPAPPGAGPPQGGGRENYCLQLEQKLAQSWSRGSQSRDQLPKLEAEMQQQQKLYQQSQAQLDRGDCYDYFLFSKTLKRSPQCLNTSKQGEDARRRIAELEGQRQSMLNGRENRAEQDELIQTLARNGCGKNYQQEAARRQQSSPFGGWTDEESPQGGGAQRARPNVPPFQTYRTVCVRLCDGYFFPISFSAVPAQFGKDADACSSRCAAPAELFYYPTPPTGAPEQMTSVSGQPYTKMTNAFRYRKEYIQGCSCKQAEFQPATPQNKKAEAAPPRTAPTGASKQAAREN